MYTSYTHSSCDIGFKIIFVFFAILETMSLPMSIALIVRWINEYLEETKEQKEELWRKQNG